MSDDQNIDAGSETSGEQAADTTVTAQADTTETTSTDTSATDTTEASVDAGGAADDSQTKAAPDADQSRTGYAEPGLRAGDTCKCPDGRTGTVHSFDQGLICIPNADQG